MSYAKYLDASAAIKLVVDECRGAELRQFFAPRTNFVMTPFCFYEALSTLKAKWKGRKDSKGGKVEITDNEYHDACYLLLTYAHQKKIEITADLDLSDPVVRPEVERIARRHGLDISDAFQLVTLQKGPDRFFTDESQSLFISADRELVTAGRAEGIKRIWDLTDLTAKAPA